LFVSIQTKTTACTPLKQTADEQIEPMVREDSSSERASNMVSQLAQQSDGFRGLCGVGEDNTLTSYANQLAVYPGGIRAYDWLAVPVSILQYNMIQCNTM